MQPESPLITTLVLIGFLLIASGFVLLCIGSSWFWVSIIVGAILTAIGEDMDMTNQGYKRNDFFGIYYKDKP